MMADMADFINEQYDPEMVWEPIKKTCALCKKRNLHWQETKDGWRLFDSKDKLHDCEEFNFDG